MNAVCVYCGASPGRGTEYLHAATSLGNAIATRGLTLVFGGSGVGLMKALADAVLESGGRAVGVIPEALMQREIAHNSLTELRVVPDMHVRKATMMELADAFVALPGGIGTLEEIVEVMSWAQLSIHTKPFGLVNTSGYYDRFLSFLDHMVTEGLLSPATRALIQARNTPEEVLDMLEDGA